MNVRVGMSVIQIKNLDKWSDIAGAFKMDLKLPDGAVIHNMERMGSFIYIFWSRDMPDEMPDEYEVGSP